MQKAVVPLGLCLVALVLAPVLASGFTSDDNVLSTLRGAAALHGESVPAMLVEAGRLQLHEQGRFIPLGTATVALVAWLEVADYKVVVLVLVLLNVWLFSRVVRALTGSKAAAGLGVALAPMFFQLRGSADPVLAFHGILQVVTFLALGMVWCWARFLKSGHRAHLFASVACFVAAVLTYEIAYALVGLPLLLALTTGDKARRERLVDAARSIHFFAAAACLVVVLLVIRSRAGLDPAGPHPAYMASFGMSYPFAVARQASAALPLSYPLFAQFRMTDVFGLDAVWAWVQTHWGPWLVVVGVWSIATLTLALGASDEPGGGPPPRPAHGLWVMGLVFWLGPSALLELSSKYRNPAWVNWGNGYLPVYLSAFGTLALATFFLLRVPRRGAVVRVSLGVLFALVTVPTAAANQAVVLKSNLMFREPRELLENALDAGLFNGIADGGYLIVLDDTAPGANASFFAMNPSPRWRRVVGTENVRGGLPPAGYMTELFFRPIQKPDEPPWFLPGTTPTWFDDRAEHLEFTEADAVYVLKVVIAPPHRGVVWVARLRDLTLATSSVGWALADRVTMYRQGAVDSPSAAASAPERTRVGADATVDRWWQLGADWVELRPLLAR